MVKNTNDFSEIDILKKSLEQLKSPWEFQGNEKSVRIETSIIEDINYNFLRIISDFYFIESVNKLEKSEKEDPDIILTLKRISDHHRFLLFLKYLYQTELKNYLGYLIKNNRRQKEIILNFQPFESVSEIWNYIFSRVKKNEYSLKVLILIYLYKNLLNISGANESDEDFLSDINNNLSLFDSRYSYGEYLKILVSLTLISDDINTFLDNQITRFQICLLEFKQSKAVPDDVYSSFANLSSLKTTIDNFSDIINNDKKLKIFYEDKVNCFASAAWNNHKYIAINGLDTKQKSKKIIDIIIELSTPQKYEYVKIPQETQYFLNQNISLPQKQKNNITYSEFEKYKIYIRKTNITKKNINSNNRMFTCCERKLISNIKKLSEEEGIIWKNNPTLELIIARKPCHLCQRTIDMISQENRFNLTIIYPKTHSENSPDLSDILIKKYDDFAIEILNSEPQKKNSD